jgi:hypothetical protein
VGVNVEGKNSGHSTLIGAPAKTLHQERHGVSWIRSDPIGLSIRYAWTFPFSYARRRPVNASPASRGMASRAPQKERLSVVRASCPSLPNSQAGRRLFIHRKNRELIIAAHNRMLARAYLPVDILGCLIYLLGKVVRCAVNELYCKSNLLPPRSSDPPILRLLQTMLNAILPRSVLCARKNSP